MSIPTSRQLEFLASLKTDWARLYRNELARLLNDKEHRTTSDISHHESLEDIPCFGFRYSLPH
jgi:hypothetical protein